MLYFTVVVFMSILVIVAYTMVKAKSPIKKVFISSISGVSTLAALNLLESITGVLLPINFTTAFVCTVLGAPGVVVLLVVKKVIENF